MSLANEIWLQIISHLPLKPLIAFRGANQQWQRFVAVAEIQPARRELLNPSLTIVHSPYFLRSHPWALANLQPFDREVHIDSLLVQYPRPPEDFRLLVLEWPARTVVRAAWPGLPLEYHDPLVGDDIE